MTLKNPDKDIQYKYMYLSKIMKGGYFEMKTRISIMIVLLAFYLGGCAADQGAYSSVDQGSAASADKTAVSADQETAVSADQEAAASTDQDTVVSGDQPAAVSENRESAEKKRKIIIDTDTGADDASAIILAACNDDIDLLGVTVLAGNVDLEQGAKNALMALELAGSDVGVYKGADENLTGQKIEAYSVYGKDGMGEADLIHPKRSVEEEDAISFILDSINKYPDEVEIVAIGPATNVAKAIERDPETMKKVKMIWSMGTAGRGPGNATPVAEFNVYSDAPAYRKMLDSGNNITIIGLDMCAEAEWTDQNFEELSKSGEAGKFVTDSFAKLREFYAMNGSPGAVMNCDGLAMTCVLYPDFVKETLQCHGSCLTDLGEAYSQVIFYLKGFTYDVAANDFKYNVTLVSEIDAGSFFEHYLQAVGSIAAGQ